AMALSLDLPASSFDQYCSEGHTSYLRLNYYPPCPDVARADAVLPVAEEMEAPPGAIMGIERHTDAGLLTILIQDDVSALQVRHDGRWNLVPSPNGRPAPQASTAFTINVRWMDP
ncbi:hypothetical protein CYMTET_24221, partial [Cymbomonas tetramitiformis]